MIRKINLGEHSESEITADQLPAVNLQNVWLELVDPQEAELQAVSLATKIPVNFLRFHKGDFVQLRLEADFFGNQLYCYSQCNVGCKALLSCDYGFRKKLPNNRSQKRNSTHN
jgi:hypothetical protein